MQPSEVINVLRLGVSFLSQIKPLAVALGGPQIAAAAQIAESALQIGNKVLENIEAGTEVWASGDQEALKAMLQALQNQNDALAGRIAQS